jgi:putative NADH-flavin reductase
MLLDRMPPERRPESQGQLEALEYYRTVSDVKWSYFSPAAGIAPGARTGKFRLGEDHAVLKDNKPSHISMEDYAVAMIDEAERPRHTGKRFTIGY